MYYRKEPIDMSDKIKEICTPLISKPEALKVCLVSEENKTQSYLIRCDSHDLGKLLGRHGMIADSLRTLVNIALRPVKRKASLKFEAYQPGER